MGEKLSKEIKTRLENIVGADSLKDDPESLQEFASNLSGSMRGTPLCLVRPRQAAQVQSLMDLARETGLNLVPASSGPPHIRGGTVPQGEGVIVDLSHMDRIVRVDRRNKVAIVEPGVRFQRLKEEAESKGMRMLMPLLPRATKSVLGSCLEREPMLIPKYHWDMTDPLLCTELIFGTGDLFRTGSAAGPGSLAEQWSKGLAQKNPMGPAQTDFGRLVQGSQGTLAMVTWASIKLEVLPQIQRFYFIPDRNLGRLVDFSYRALRRKLGDEFLILNGFELATILAEDHQRIKELASREAPFTLIFSVTGYQYYPDKKVAYQEEDMAGIAQACGLEIKRDIPGANGKLIGEILSNPSPEPYYRQRFKGGFRELFFLTTMNRAPSFCSLVSEVISRRGYPREELGIYLQPIQQGRACHLEFHLYYDPSDKSSALSVEEIIGEAAAAVAEAGAFFSRPYGSWAELAYARCPDTVIALKRMKKILDPAGVLNRGKLCFTEEV